MRQASTRRFNKLMDTFHDYSLPVRDKSGQRTLFNQDFEILSWTEVLQEVQSNLNKVSPKFLGLSRLNQHLINCFRHYRRTY
jgi:stress-induced morphogen